MKQFNKKNYYTLIDLQKKLGVAYVTIQRWKDKFPMIKIGNRNYLDENIFNNIEEFLSK